MTMNLVQSIKETDLKEGCMKPVRLKGRAILLIRKGGAVFGVSNCCPHMGCSLERGILRDYLVMCPSHGWKFDIRNGKYTENEGISLISYPCKIQDGRVYVELADK